MGNWGHREAKESPFKEESVPGAEGVCQHRETTFFFLRISPGFPLLPARTLGPVGGGGKRERRTPYLLLIRHPILEVGHLGCSGPARRPARGRPGRKLSGGITKGAVGRTRPEAPAKRAPCQFRAGVTARSGNALGSRPCPQGLGV